MLRSRSGKPIGLASSTPCSAFLHRRVEVTIVGVVLASFLTSTWPIAIAGFVLVAEEFLVLSGPRVVTRSDPFPTGDEEARLAPA